MKGEALLRPFLQQASGQILQDDVNGFSSTSVIYFMIRRNPMRGGHCVNMDYGNYLCSADLPNLVSFIFVCKHTQLDEGKYDISNLFALYKDAECDRLSYSLCLFKNFHAKYLARPRRHIPIRKLADFLLQESRGFRTGLSRGFAGLMLVELLRSFHTIPNFLNKSQRPLSQG